ncbi:unnamed protein product [Penicillium pancosmium]
MSRLPDLVRDSKLETRFVPDFNVETVHTYHESERSRRRLVPVLEHWKRQDKIGGGGYSTVWLESCPKVSRHGVQVRAVKQIETGGRFARIDFNRELEAIAKFSHPKYERCFVKSFGWYSTPENLFISMEYLKLGDLHDYLLDRPPLSESQAQDISYQILEGLQMMHENEFMHRDLKPKNILIKSHPPQEWWIKIADFGISKRMEEAPETSTTLRGTAGFIAPELYGFINAGSLYAPDIWSSGEIIFQILTKKPAFKPIGQLVLYMRQPEMFPSTALSDAGVTEICIEFIRSLMNPKPDSRLTTEMALEHAWMRPPSEVLTIPEVKPLPTVDNDQNPVQTDEQRTDSHTEIGASGSKTLRPRTKYRGMIPKAATVEDYDSTDEDKPSSPPPSVTLEKDGSAIEKDTQQNELVTEIQTNDELPSHSGRGNRSPSPNMAPVEDCDATDEESQHLAHALEESYNYQISRAKQIPIGELHELTDPRGPDDSDEESESSVRSSAAVYNYQAPPRKKKQRDGIHERVDPRGPDLLHSRNITRSVSPNFDEYYTTDEESLFSGLSGYAVWVNLEGCPSYEDIDEKVSESPSLRPGKPIPSRTERQHTESQRRIADWLSIRNCHLINEKNHKPPISPATASASDLTGGRSEDENSPNISKAKRSTWVPERTSRRLRDSSYSKPIPQFRTVSDASFPRDSYEPPEVTSDPDRPRVFYGHFPSKDQHSEPTGMILPPLHATPPEPSSADNAFRDYLSGRRSRKYRDDDQVLADKPNGDDSPAITSRYTIDTITLEPKARYSRPTRDDRPAITSRYTIDPTIAIESPKLRSDRPSRKHRGDDHVLADRPTGDDRPPITSRYTIDTITLEPKARSSQPTRNFADFESTSSHSSDGSTASKDPQKKETAERDEEISSPQLWASRDHLSDEESFIPKYRTRDSGQSSEDEKPWREKGKTRIPRKLLHARAIRVRGYPFKVEVGSSK